MVETPNNPIAPLRLIEPALPGKLMLRGKPEIVGAGLAQLGFNLPGAVNRAADGSAGRAICLGPDEHLLLLEAERLADVLRSLGEALADRHHALVDVSARLVALELSGDVDGATATRPDGLQRSAGAGVPTSDDQSARRKASQMPARDTLAAACPLDLHSAVFASGQATRTVFGKAEIILDCLGPDRFRLLTNRSFADYLRRLLQEAGREFGLARDPAA